MPEKKLKVQWRKEGKTIRKEEIIGAVWHKGIQGRNDKDVCLTLIKVLHELMKLCSGRLIVLDK